MNRHLLAILSIAAALGLAGAGCGDDEETTSTATALEETTTADTTAAEETSTEEEGDAEGHPGMSESAPPPAEVQIEHGVEAFLSSPDSAEVCEDLVTDDLIKQSYGGLQGCLEGRPKPTLAEGAKLSAPKIIDGSATVTATPDGGLYDGVEVEFTFVQEGETWLIDSVSADIPVGP